MTPDELQKTVVLITSQQPKNSGFGTGFIVKIQGFTSYLVTCAHVVKEVGGKEFLRVEGNAGIVIASGEDQGIDLAVVRVEGLKRNEWLKLGTGEERTPEFMSAGFHLSGKRHLLKVSRGEFGLPVEMAISGSGKRTQLWELNISGENGLQRGCSGSPLVNEMSGEVIAIASHRQGEKKGYGLGIEELRKFWELVDSETLYKTLTKLGYKQQIRLFKKLKKSVKMAALLIHGDSPNYCQRWLLNLLMNHLPEQEDEDEYSLVVRIECKRISRKIKNSVITEELCRALNIDSNQATLEEIASRVYQCLQYRNLILIYHDIDYIGGENVKKILEELWQPLLKEVHGKKDSTMVNKFFLFLIDYEGKSEEIRQLFQDKIERMKEENYQFKLPKIQEFTEPDLLTWSEQYELPEKLVEEIEEQVEEILSESEGGIPEMTFDQICRRCELNWFEESEKWMIY